MEFPIHLPPLQQQQQPNVTSWLVRTEKSARCARSSSLSDYANCLQHSRGKSEREGRNGFVNASASKVATNSGFHQPLCKCASSESFAQSVSLTKFYQYTQLEVMPNSYALCSVPYTSKLSVILLAQNLLIKWWQSCNQSSISPSLWCKVKMRWCMALVKNVSPTELYPTLLDHTIRS